MEGASCWREATIGGRPLLKGDHYWRPLEGGHYWREATIGGRRPLLEGGLASSSNELFALCSLLGLTQQCIVHVLPSQ